MEKTSPQVATKISIENLSTIEIEKYMVKYPYFSYLYNLYLTKIYFEQPENFQSKLKKYGIYLTNPYFFVEQLCNKKNNNPEAEIDEIEIDDTTTTIDNEIETAESIALSEMIDIDESKEVMTKAKNYETSAILSNWKDDDMLAFDYEAPSRRKKNNQSQEQSKNNIIDAFLNSGNSTKIIINENTYEGDLTGNSTTFDDALLTEKIAQIYVHQKNYSKAIEVYSKLSLKNPEKSAYFATQIETLKNINI